MHACVASWLMTTMTRGGRSTITAAFAICYCDDGAAAGIVSATTAAVAAASAYCHCSSSRCCSRNCFCYTSSFMLFTDSLPTAFYCAECINCKLPAVDNLLFACRWPPSPTLNFSLSMSICCCTSCLALFSLFSWVCWLLAADYWLMTSDRALCAVCSLLPSACCSQPSKCQPSARYHSPRPRPLPVLLTAHGLPLTARCCR